MVAPLAREHGVEYLLAAVVLGGVLQVVLAAVGVARLMRFLPRSVLVGFVNALAMLIFTSQLPYLANVPWAVYALLAVGLVVLVGLPRISKVVPAPLVAILALTGFTVLAGVVVPPSATTGRCPTPSRSSVSPRCPSTSPRWR